MPPNPPPIRAAIIGLGFIGAGDQVSGDAIGGQQVANLDGTHLQAYQRHPRFELVAGSSRDPGRRERFSQRTRNSGGSGGSGGSGASGGTGVRTYADWQEMIDRERLDVVSVATYAPTHAEIVIACARRGIRVIWCEKPIATTVDDAAAMLRACEEAGTLLVVNHNRRFNPNYQRLRALIAAGELGELTSAALRWGSGRLGNVGTHLIDALSMVTSRRVEAVSATLDPAGRPDCRGGEFHDPGGWGVLRLEGGLMVTLDAADHAAGPTTLTVYGTRGGAVTGRDEVALTFWDGRSDRWPGRRQEATSMDRAAAEIAEYLDGSRRALSHTAEEARAVLEAIVACHASHRRVGQWVTLPLQREDRAIEVHSG